MSIARVPQIGSAQPGRRPGRDGAGAGQGQLPPTRVVARPRENARQPVIPPGLHAPVMAQIIAFTLDQKLGGPAPAARAASGAYGGTAGRILEARRTKGGSWVA